MPERSVIHLNIADFAVAVERSLDRRLDKRPVVIAAEGQARSAVYDMSEEAYAAGVRKGMALLRARKLCREATVLPPHPDRYERAMRAFLKCALPYSPLVEATDHQGHLFIDASGTERLFGPAMDVAWRIRKAARNDLGLNPIWAVATNKLLAKIASRIVKPDGECCVEAGDEEQFLKPLPVHLLPGLEPDDLQRLREFRLATMGDVAAWTQAQLTTIFCASGRHLYESVRGVDPSPVLSVSGQPPRVAAEQEFGEDTNDQDTLLAALFTLAEKAGRSLREQRLAARRIGVFLDYSDGFRACRSVSPERPSANDFTLFDQARRALDLAWYRRVRIRHLRLVCDRLTFPAGQLELFGAPDPSEEQRERLVAAMDAIRDRFGAAAIYVGRSRETGQSA